MELAQFEAMVARLERESRASPGAYQARVALLGFGLMAAIVGLAGLVLLLVAGLMVAVVSTGGQALIVAMRLGKLLILMIVPLWVLLRTSVTALLAGELLQVQRCLASVGGKVAHAWLARRVLPADAQVRSFVLAVQFTAWARWRGKEGELINKLAECEWPVPVILCAVRAHDRVWLPRMQVPVGSEIARA